jgi:hypothetical protein
MRPEKLNAAISIIFSNIVVASIDGITAEEWDDIKQTVISLAGKGGEGLFHDLSIEEAGKSFQQAGEWHNSLDQSQRIEAAVECCLWIYNNLKAIEGRKHIVTYFDYTATADGKFTPQEKELVDMFSSLIIDGKQS